MIQNERQYKITHSQLDAMSEALSLYSSSAEINEPAWLVKAQIEALNSQILDLKSELIEYELIKEGKNRYTESSSLDELPMVLIKARISKGLSQRALAEQVGLSMQQIQRYESSLYSGASLARLVEIANVLGVSMNSSWAGHAADSANSIYAWKGTESVQWDKFPIKEMIQRGWVDPEVSMPVSDLMSQYFHRTAGSEYLSALHRKKFHGENRPNEYSLLAWQARVLEIASDEIDNGRISSFELDDSWLKDLVKLSVEDDGPLRAKSLLAENGISLVFEPHLTGTYLDGAAMLHNSGNPVVALTLRHDRLDNFWFVLFHELGHVFLHLFDSLGMDFFDEDDGGEIDQIEKEADEFSLNTLIPLDLWDSCLSRFSITDEAVILDAERLGIHPSIIAGRIRQESDKFYLLTELLGSGKVRLLFEE